MFKVVLEDYFIDVGVGGGWYKMMICNLTNSFETELSTIFNNNI
jgi:hypothetical protein